MNQVPVCTRSPSARAASTIPGPHRRRQTKIAVVHQPDRLFITADLHHAGDRSEDLLAHHAHAVIDIEQKLRRQVRVPARLAANRRSSIAARAPLETEAATCLRICSAAAGRTTGPSVVAGSVGRPSTYFSVKEMAPGDKVVVQALVNVDSLDAATGLTAVEKCAVHEILNGMRKIRILTHVRRITTSELEARPYESCNRCALNGSPALHRPRECNKRNARITNDPFGVLVTQVEKLKDSIRQSRRAKTLRKTFCAQRRLRRVFQNDAIAGHDGGNHAVHRDQIRVIPGRYCEDHTQGLASNETLEAVLRCRVQILERLGRYA